MAVHLRRWRAPVVVPVLVVHAEPRVAAVVALHEGGRQGAQHACAAGEGRMCELPAQPPSHMLQCM